MIFKARFLVGLLFTLLLASAICSAQTNTPRTPPTQNQNEDETDADVPRSFRELMVKRRLAQQKKQHDEMLKRGAQALKISEDLESSYSKNGGLSAKDRQKLAQLEKIVTKIRNDLGGHDANDKDAKTADSPKSLDQAFVYLKSSTEALVSELKRTTRFSISAVAIETSNSVIRLARFLRLRK